MLSKKIKELEQSIKDEFFRSRLTFRELSKELGISPATASRAILGDGAVKFDTVKRVAEYIDSKRA